ncbi:undecaprenyldiphospho-muramoylpentapeptide beta-N-acetylglucosaminyltransferase [Neomicrococcus aestuarii]|uniref:undecaprenyldiphospho-muramoylpentapeptide beta-N-acetylglucosaminyltransferase n=1 Tax=Neomicrococcus aestuarii TaxID=556325 RepID=UPI000A494715|nr:undecaprenyldiphospho-muramoylpentapeptide beta-N-acetylglucosaminyltransferase [Neomicrococcus aestuarii]
MENSISRPLSIVLAGGGTAGHISPMLAIADALKAEDAATDVTVVGTPSGMETRIVPLAGYELKTIHRVPMPRRPSVDLLKFPGRFAAAIRQAGDILDAAQADVAVGVGGYVCTPVYLAARRRRIPVVLHEANAKAGLANKLGARFAARIAAAFPGTGLERVEIVGMPMKSAIANLDRKARQRQAREFFGLDPDRPTIVVTGGSLGAASLNQTLKSVLPKLPESELQILHITGKGKAILDQQGQPVQQPGYVQTEFVDGMENAYAAADLFISRAGAGTVCELAAVGVPAILVPLPIGNGEQKLNARPLVEAGGAHMVEDTGFTPEWFLSTVVPLALNAQRLDAMSEASTRVGRRDAAERMAVLIREEAIKFRTQPTAAKED